MEWTYIFVTGFSKDVATEARITPIRYRFR